MQHQNRAGSMLLLQIHGDLHQPALAQSGVVLDLKGLKRPTIHRRSAHPSHKHCTGCCITTPAPEFKPWIQGLGAQFNLNRRHRSTPRERRQKRQFIPGFQLLIRPHQLLIHGNADALQRAQGQLIPQLPSRNRIGSAGPHPFAPAGAIPQRREQQHLQHPGCPS